MNNKESNLLLSKERRLLEREDDCRLQLSRLKNTEEELFYLQQTEGRLISELVDTYKEPRFFFENLQNDAHQEQEKLRDFLDKEIKKLEKERKNISQEIDSVHQLRMRALKNNGLWWHKYVFG